MSRAFLLNNFVFSTLVKWISIIFLFCVLTGFSQDLEGKWIGITTQEPNREFYFEINIIHDGGKNYHGTTIIKEEESGNYGVIKYTATFEQDKFIFQESEITTEDKSKEDGYWKSNNFNWCIKSGELDFVNDSKQFKLIGPWKAPGTCKPGTISVVKKDDKQDKKETLSDCLGNPKSADFLYGMWSGIFHQYSCNIDNTYPMFLLIDKVEGLRFSGAFIWPANGYHSDSRSTLEGEIKNGEIFIYEDEIISGSGLVLNGIYECNIVNCDEMGGIWYLRKYQSGGCNQPHVLKDGGNMNLKHYEIPTIYFDHESKELSKKSIEDLNDFASFMKKFENLKIELDGHTDNTGSNAFNLILSNERSEVVRDYLISKGISGKRLSIKHFAQTKPVASNDNEDGKALNRRTEIVVIKK